MGKYRVKYVRTFRFDLSYTSTAVLTCINHSRREAALFSQLHACTGIRCRFVVRRYYLPYTWQQRHRLLRTSHSPSLRQLKRYRQCIVSPYGQLFSVYWKVNHDTFPRVHHMETSLHSTSSTRQQVVVGISSSAGRQCTVGPFGQFFSVYQKVRDDKFPRVDRIEINGHPDSNTRQKVIQGVSMNVRFALTYQIPLHTAVSTFMTHIQQRRRCIICQTWAFTGIIYISHWELIFLRRIVSCRPCTRGTNCFLYFPTFPLQIVFTIKKAVEALIASYLAFSLISSNQQTVVHSLSVSTTFRVCIFVTLPFLRWIRLNVYQFNKIPIPSSPSGHQNLSCIEYVQFALAQHIPVEQY